MSVLRNTASDWKESTEVLIALRLFIKQTLQTVIGLHASVKKNI